MIDFTKEFHTISKELKNKKNILIISHNDADGITSAFVFARILEKEGYFYEDDFKVWIVDNQFREKIEKDEKTLKLIRKNDLVVFLDYSLKDYSYLKVPAIVIDHHKTDKKAYIEVNPANKLKPENMPSASALTYALYKYLYGENKVVKKVAFMGALGDLMVFQSLPYLNIEETDINFFLNGLVQFVFYEANKIFQIMNEDHKLSKDIFEYMLENVKENIIPLIILPDEWTNIIVKYMKKENKHIKKILEKLEIYENEKIVFGYVSVRDSPYFAKLKGLINSTYAEYDLFLFKKLPENLGYRVSARSQKRLDLTKLVAYVKEKIPDSQGGGHPFAAGIYVKPKYFNKLKKLILNNYDKFYREK